MEQITNTAKMWIQIYTLGKNGVENLTEWEAAEKSLNENDEVRRYEKAQRDYQLEKKR